MPRLTQMLSGVGAAGSTRNVMRSFCPALRMSADANEGTEAKSAQVRSQRFMVDLRKETPRDSFGEDIGEAGALRKLSSRLDTRTVHPRKPSRKAGDCRQSGGACAASAALGHA
jgi:hypothetical protein